MLLDSLKRDGFTTAERNTLRKLVAKSPVRQPTALLPHPRRACVLWGGANRVLLGACACGVAAPQRKSVVQTPFLARSVGGSSRTSRRRKRRRASSAWPRAATLRPDAGVADRSGCRRLRRRRCYLPEAGGGVVTAASPVSLKNCVSSVQPRNSNKGHKCFQL